MKIQLSTFMLSVVALILLLVAAVTTANTIAECWSHFTLAENIYFVVFSGFVWSTLFIGYWKMMCDCIKESKNNDK